MSIEYELTTEMVAFYRKLAAQRPEEFRPKLASSLSHLASILSELDRREEALAAAEEGVALCRELAAQQPDAFRPDLARSLNLLAALRKTLGQREEALAAAEEGTMLYRQLAARRPDEFQLALAMSLAVRANCLDALERTEDALAINFEAITNLAPVFVEDPVATGPQVVRLLRQHRKRCERLGRDPARELLAHLDIDQLGPLLLLIDQFLTDQDSQAEKEPGDPAGQLLAHQAERLRANFGGFLLGGLRRLLAHFRLIGRLRKS